MKRRKARQVALLLPSLQGGGAERVMLNLAQGFAERGIKVDLVLARAQGPYLSQVPPCVRVVDLGRSRMLTSLPGLVRYLRRERPAALLSAMNHVNLIAIVARRLAGQKLRLVVSEHNTLSVSVANARTLRARLIPAMIKVLYPWADAIVTVSQGVADDLARVTELARDSFTIIYNPVITPELFAKAEEPVDHPWFASGQPPVVLGVGRLTPQKDFPTLIRAFALLRQERSARLMILGEGEERLKLETLMRQMGLEQDVSFPGFVENPFKFMKKAKVFVLSSRWEGLPTVLIEALALGTPVVSTDCPSGPREILEDGRWGALVSVGNEEAMARAMRQVIDGDLALTGNEKPNIDKYSLAGVVDSYLSILGLEVGQNVG